MYEYTRKWNEKKTTLFYNYLESITTIKNYGFTHKQIEREKYEPKEGQSTNYYILIIHYFG